MLLFRARALAKREPAAVMGRFGASVFMSILLISVFYQANEDSDSSGHHLPVPDKSQIQNLIGAMFLIMMFQFMVNTFSNVLVF